MGNVDCNSSEDKICATNSAFILPLFECREELNNLSTIICDCSLLNIEAALLIALERLALDSLGSDVAVVGLLFSKYVLNFSKDEMCVIEGNT